MLAWIADNPHATRAATLARFGKRRPTAIRSTVIRGADVLDWLVSAGFVRERQIVGRAARFVAVTGAGRAALRARATGGDVGAHTNHQA